MDKNSMTLGYLVGRQIAGQRRKKPVAYLYNGVRLPVLPEWDGEKYPYAFIVGLSTSTGGINYDFVVCANPLTYTTARRPDFSYYYAVSLYGDGCTFDLENDEWVIWDVGKLLSGNYEADKILFLWSNHDIVNSADGSIYLAKSDPIPVYE